MSLHDAPVSLLRRRAPGESDLCGFERTMYAVVCVTSGLFAFLIGAAALLTGPVAVDAAVQPGVVTAAVYGGFGSLAVISGVALYRQRVLGWVGGVVALAIIAGWGLVLAVGGAVHGVLTTIALAPVVWRLVADRPRRHL